MWKRGAVLVVFTLLILMIAWEERDPGSDRSIDDPVSSRFFPGLISQKVSDEVTGIRNSMRRGGPGKAVSNVEPKSHPVPFPLHRTRRALHDTLPFQRERAELRELDPQRGFPRFLFGPRGRLRSVSGTFNLAEAQVDQGSAASRFVSRFPTLFGIGSLEEIVEVATGAEAPESFVIRLGRLHGALPVWGREVVVSMEGSSVVSVTGNFRSIDQVIDVSQKLSVADFRRIIEDHFDEEVTIDPLIEEGIFTQAGLALHTYRGIVDVVSSPKRWQVYVSPSLKGIVSKIPRFYSATPSRGDDLKGIEREFNSVFQDDHFILKDTSFPSESDTRISDWDQGLISYASSTQPNGGWDAAAVSAVHNARSAYEYFSSVHNRDSFDGEGSTLRSVVNVDLADRIDNASWSANTMYYGRGRQLRNMAVSLDVAAHELTHGVIDHSSNLRYQNQSGALNESFADFFGSMVDRDNWYIGEDLFKDGGFFRSMSDPPSGGQPGHFRNYRFFSRDQDHGGVHYNSGIQNRALYLLSEGLSNEGLGTSIGKDKAEQIVYRALVRLTEDSEFIDSATQMVLQASALFGEGSPEVQAVEDAWREVGISLSSAPTREVDGQEVFELADGDDVLVHLFPRDGTLDHPGARTEEYDVYLTVVNQPYAGFNSERLVGPINDQPAAGIRPSVGTSPFGMWVDYVGTDGNSYLTAGLEGYEDAVYDIEDDVSFVARTNDGSKLALVVEGSTIIWVFSFLTETWQPFEVRGPDYRENGDGAEIEVVDSINFDYSGRKIIFDYRSCVPDPEVDDGCASIWGIGILDLDAGFHYPFPNQRTNVDLGFPQFANLRNDVFAFDYLDWSDFEETGKASSSIAVFDSKTKAFTFLANPNGSDRQFAFGVPSFIGDDRAVSFQFQLEDSAAMWQVTIDDEYQPVDDTYQNLLPYDSGFGQAHRNSYQEVKARLLIDRQSAEFSPIRLGATASMDFRLSNDGTRSIEIVEIARTNGLSLNLTNTTVQIGEAITFSVQLDTKDMNTGVFSGTVRIEHDGDNGPLEIGLTAVVDTDNDDDGTFDEVDTDDDNDGVSDDDDEFPNDAGESRDHDGDGVGNNADTDDDNDGFSDDLESELGSDPLARDCPPAICRSGTWRLKQYQEISE